MEERHTAAPAAFVARDTRPHLEPEMIRIAEGAARSLSEAQPDEWVRVEHILYESLREFCESIELHEGDQLLCRSNGSFVVLRSQSGRNVIVAQDRARFIRVRGCDEQTD